MASPRRLRYPVRVTFWALVVAAIAVATAAATGTTAPSLRHSVPAVLRAHSASAHSAGTANPTRNIPPRPAYASNPACIASNDILSPARPACTALQLRAMDAARASEGVGPLYLPTNWSSLTPVRQLFVLVDLERVDRGLAPFAGLTVALDHIAQLGASPAGHPGAAVDPVLPGSYSAGPGTALAINCVPSGAGYTCPGAGFPGDSVAAEAMDPLAAVYDWMYEDGWGGTRSTTLNADCTSAGAAKCWIHRDDILGPYPTTAGFALTTPAGPARQLTAKKPTTLIMGAGNTTSGRFQADTAVFLAMIGPPPPFIYTWAQALAAGANRP